ncbi:MAG: hypothetical protein M3Q99_00655 [Acidobacteriota bacterium]|nr:hypothetical protein [Acidobacteriota bacterium]
MKLAKIFIVFTFLLAFAVCVSAQSVQFPNELKGYKFFGKGKLKKIKLGGSTKKDVKKIFGKDCEKGCDYDENFKVKFEYLAALDDCMTTEDIRDRAVCPQNEFVGTISSVILEPKQEQSLKDLPTSKFNKVSGGSTTEKGSGVSSSYTSFTDKYGLRYSTNNELSGKIVVYSQYPPFVEGKLYSIKYIFTDDFIRKVFTVEYMTRQKELNK